MNTLSHFQYNKLLKELVKVALAPQSLCVVREQRTPGNGNADEFYGERVFVGIGLPQLLPRLQRKRLRKESAANEEEGIQRD